MENQDLRARAATTSSTQSSPRPTSSTCARRRSCICSRWTSRSTAFRRPGSPPVEPVSLTFTVTDSDRARRRQRDADRERDGDGDLRRRHRRRGSPTRTARSCSRSLPLGFAVRVVVDRDANGAAGGRTLGSTSPDPLTHGVVDEAGLQRPRDHAARAGRRGLPRARGGAAECAAAAPIALMITPGLASAAERGSPAAPRPRPDPAAPTARAARRCRCRASR